MAFLQNQDQVFYGEAAQSHGFELLGADNPLGLLSFGLIWEQNDIWSTSDQTGTCIWADGNQSGACSWSDGDQAVAATTWTQLTGGAWGEN